MTDKDVEELYAGIMRMPSLEIRGLAELPTFPDSLSVMGAHTHVAPLERRESPPPPTIFYEAIMLADVAPDSNELESREWALYGDEPMDDAVAEDREQSLDNPAGEVIAMVNGNLAEARDLLDFFAQAPQLIFSLIGDLRFSRTEVAFLQHERGDSGVQDIIKRRQEQMLDGTTYAQALDNIVTQWWVDHGQASI